MAEWTVEMRATYRLVVTVEADTEDDARERAMSLDWVDDMLDGLLDWEVTHRPKQIQEAADTLS